MELGNFGAIIRYALELEQQSEEHYEKASEQTQKELYLQFLVESQKRSSELKRARREGVVEMVLEPITGLDSDDYQVSFSLPSREAEFVEIAIQLEDNVFRFYRDAAEKLTVPGVARLFMRLCRRSEDQKALLEAQLKKAGVD